MLSKSWRKNLEKNYKLELSAKQDIKESIFYYEERKEGLGGEFFDEVNLKIKEIIEKPEKYSIYYKNTRKASLQKFPFIIVYIIEELSISILGVWHKSRGPNQLEKRIDEK